MYKMHPDFETKNGGKKCVLYTGVYGTLRHTFKGEHNGNLNLNTL